MNQTPAGQADIGRRVLIVEDEAMIAMLLELVLQNADCAVVGPAASVGSALRLIERQKLDAAVLDFRLGDDDSGEIMDLLDQRGVPFLLMTGQSMADLPAKLRHLNLLAKPFEPEALVEAVEKILSAPVRMGS